MAVVLVLTLESMKERRGGCNRRRCTERIVDNR
jgi:hypothetical protein